MPGICARVQVNGHVELEIECGEGRQTVYWLALAAAERFAQLQRPGGRIRQRESGVKDKGQFTPVAVQVNDILVYPGAKIRSVLKNVRSDNPRKHALETFLEPSSELCLPRARKSPNKTKDSSKEPLHRLAREVSFNVTLATSLECSGNKIPRVAGFDSTWRDLAFGHSGASRKRIEDMKEEKMQEQEEREALRKAQKLKKSMLSFLESIRREDLVEEFADLPTQDWSGEGVFYPEEDELGVCAVQDWGALEPHLSTFLPKGTPGVGPLKRHLFTNYRLLRDAYKMYSGLGNDSSGKMSFTELMYLLQDTGTLEMKDSELVWRIIAPVHRPASLGARRRSIHSGGEEKYQTPDPQESYLLSRNELQLCRSTFMECIIRLFTSEDLYTIHQARVGNFDSINAVTLPKPVERFKYFLTEYIVPSLEQKVFSKQTRRALTSIHVLSVFAQDFDDLLRIFNQAAVLFPNSGKDDSGNGSMRQRVALRMSFSSTSEEPSSSPNKTGTLSSSPVSFQPSNVASTGNGLNLREFLLVLRKAGLVEASGGEAFDHNSLRFLTSSSHRESILSSTMSLLVEDDTQEMKRQDSTYLLNYADAKALFAVSLFEKDAGLSSGTAADELSFREFVEAIVRLALIRSSHQTTSESQHPDLVRVIVEHLSQVDFTDHRSRFK